MIDTRIWWGPNLRELVVVMLRSLIESCTPLLKPLALLVAVVIGLAVASTDATQLRNWRASAAVSGGIGCQTPIIGAFCGVSLRALFR